MSSVAISEDAHDWSWDRPEPDSVAAAPNPVARRTIFAHRFGAVLAGTDFLAVALGAALFAPRTSLWSVAAFAVAVLVVCAVRDQYTWRTTLSVGKDAGTLAAAVALPLLTTAVFGGFGSQVRPIVVLGVASLGLLLLGRTFAYAGIRRARTSGALVQRVLIVGAGQVAERLVRVFETHPDYGLQPIGFLHDDLDESLSLPVLGGTDDLDEVLREHRIDRVVIAFGTHRSSDLVRIIRRCENASVEMYVVPRFFELGLQGVPRDAEMVWGFPLVRLRRSSVRRAPRRAKRVFDSCVAAGLLALTAPLFGVLALGVKLSSPGPVFFRQRRIGMHGRVVEVLKFRSMRQNSDSDTQWSVNADSRVTGIGHFMRKTSLDELPQFWNVLRGDMSLVGPRPERPHFVQTFSKEVSGYGERHRVPVGLTGLAQINGLRGDTSIEDRVWFDNQYIENWSPVGDLSILARTAGAMVKQARE
jgi:exopolysaccharide biosynthesis polyprenyl glycosylphosphotransferase